LEYQVDTTDIEDDFVLSEGPGYAAAMCAKCGKIKPAKEFKRKLTKAQSRARGHMGNVALEIESSMCKSCQPRLKDVQHLTTQELHNRVSAGDLNPTIAKTLIEKRDRQARAAMRAAAKRAWDNVRTEPWATPISTAQAELTRLRQQEKYVKTHLNLTTIEIDLTFFVEYKLLLTATLARMKFEKMRSCKEPPFLDWQGFVEMPTYHRLFEMWEAMPAEYRKRVKPPALFAILPGDAKVCPPINSLSTKPDPAARLAQGGGREKGTVTSSSEGQF
jgi:hypothetical protein